MNKMFILKLIIVLLIALNAVTFSNFYSQNEADRCFLENDKNYILIEKNELNNSITSYLYKDNTDNYLSKLYEDDKEITINDLIKPEKMAEYKQKVEELLYLKYPKFIASSLLKEDVLNSYILRDNELVIYFNNYQITPEVTDILYLKVNYNEIKDYLNFTFILDKDYENETGYNYTNAKKSIAFTFDDSPNNNKTNKIVNYLNDNLSHATFFMLGNKMKNHRDLVLTVLNSGNEIGSHTYSHQNMSKMTNEEVINDFNLMNDLYKSITGNDLKYLRPPYGVIKNTQKSLINASFILWSLDTNDWRYRNKNYIINYVLNNVQDGDIILFHDSYQETVEAIEELLPLLYSKGYQVMSVSELFQIKNKELELNEDYRKVS